ncbi:MAG: ferritin family protein [Deltaproteobacteria bacterium]|nr:ferritin family protein [Deltaproteobacteria bacterium]
MTDPIQCSIDMLNTALEMEEKGKAFYEKAVKTCGNPQCQEIFSALVKDEVLHQERIKQIHDTLTSGKCWTRDWESIESTSENLGVLFQNLAARERKKMKAETTDVEALDIGLDFELASVAFYQDHRARTADPLEAAFLDQMILEEKEHWKALKDTRYYLTDPEGWFIEKERAGLDGAP